MNEEIIKPENLVYKKTDLLLDNDFHYCPGCGHGTVHKLFMEVVEEMGIGDNTIGVAPVGCSVFAYNYMNVDMQQAPHGRACAFATGMKRTLPDRYVFTYQGDGDLAAIGTAETIHAASRGENILVIFINNGLYGMTSGQMAPTTLPGMKTTTSPHGRDVKTMGHPLVMTNLMKEMPGVAYLTRHSVHKVGNCRKLKKAFQNALNYQKQGLGFCMVEVVTNCPSNMKTTANKANDFVDNEMIPFYPLGDIKVPIVA
ncbi:MAG: 2-oxoglutarate oxidoreductase [Ignavibacteria bacterium]|jgi:2-oxoglutarate ferredoxin oxidoreductase subunit beta|nr:2-oxoglutarate oxidoreductase [Ignavibacteria bacterium]